MDQRSSIKTDVLQILDQCPGLNKNELHDKLSNAATPSETDFDAILTELKNEHKVSDVLFKGETLYYLVGPTKADQTIRQENEAREQSNQKSIMIFAIIAVLAVFLFLTLTEAGEMVMYFGAIVIVVLLIFKWAFS